MNPLFIHRADANGYGYPCNLCYGTKPVTPIGTVSYDIAHDLTVAICDECMPSVHDPTSAIYVADVSDKIRNIAYINCTKDICGHCGRC